MQIIIGGRFKIIKRIGQGSFGQIFQAINIKQGHKVAIKLQNINSKYPQLLYQAHVLIELLGNDSLTDKGLPNVYSQGTQGQFNYLVLDLLGFSLKDLFTQCDGIFSLKTTLMLADQMIKRIQYVHSKGYLHRDIKPQNFLLSTKKDRKIYLIDFGLARKYIKNGKHIEYAQNKSMVGTVRYASLNMHYGIQPTRRDDLQSWFYTICQFLTGELPWQNQKGKTKKDKYDKIMSLKIEWRPQLLCKNLPKQFLIIQTYIKKIKFDEKPNYQYIKNEIKKCIKYNNIQYDYNYDWQKKKQLQNKYKIKLIT